MNLMLFSENIDQKNSRKYIIDNFICKFNYIWIYILYIFKNIDSLKKYFKIQKLSDNMQANFQE